MFVSGAEQLPGGRKSWQPSPFAARLSHDELSDSYQRLDLQRAEPQRRIDETVVPTTFSQIRYYLRCPADYQYRHVWGFSPPITEMFGFGQTVHAAVGRLHERFQETAPTPEAAEEVARRIFHLKHVPPSNDPVERPGAYEEAEQAAVGIVRRYADDYSDDFSHERQVELAFEIPVEKAVISGAIDLVLRYDDQGELLEAAVIDFKSMEGGDEPLESPDLDWTDLSLQVQLYAKAAREVLGENARTGAVHLLKDGQRVSVPVDDDAIAAAVANVEWAVRGVIAERFPMRGHPEKCEACDWAKICPQSVEELGTEPPPQLYLPQPIHRSSVKAIDQAAEPD
jgi:DNA helicase-2/ATP-dependent DNA helicase PcrA